VGFPRHSYTLCDKLLVLEMAKSYERGKPVHEKCYVLHLFPDPTNILDYPDAMSGYERESRWADAKLLLRKQRNRGALQEQVSPEFSSMICVLLYCSVLNSALRPG
jgi:hypothetical protein